MKTPPSCSVRLLREARNGRGDVYAASHAVLQACRAPGFPPEIVGRVISTRAGKPAPQRWAGKRHIPVQFPLSKSIAMKRGPRSRDLPRGFLHGFLFQMCGKTWCQSVVSGGCVRVWCRGVVSGGGVRGWCHGVVSGGGVTG